MEKEEIEINSKRVSPIGASLSDTESSIELTKSESKLEPEAVNETKSPGDTVEAIASTTTSEPPKDDDNQITIRTTVNPAANEAVIRIFSATPILHRSPTIASNVKTSYDPVTGDLLIVIKRTNESEDPVVFEKSKKADTARPDFIRRQNKFGRPLQFASRNKYDKSVLKVPPRERQKIYNFEPIEEALVEDDESYNKDKETTKDIFSKEIFKERSMVEPGLGKTEQISTTTSVNSFLQSPKNHSKTTKKLTSIKNPTGVPCLKKNIVRPLPFSIKYRPNRKKITNTTEKKIFYLTRTLLLGQITQRTEDTRTPHVRKGSTKVYNRDVGGSYAPIFVEYDDDRENYEMSSFKFKKNPMLSRGNKGIPDEYELEDVEDSNEYLDGDAYEMNKVFAKSMKSRVNNNEKGINSQNYNEVNALKSNSTFKKSSNSKTDYNSSGLDNDGFKEFDDERNHYSDMSTFDSELESKRRTLAALNFNDVKYRENRKLHKMPTEIPEEGAFGRKIHESDFLTTKNVNKNRTPQSAVSKHNSRALMQTRTHSYRSSAMRERKPVAYLNEPDDDKKEASYHHGFADAKALRNKHRSSGPDGSKKLTNQGQKSETAAEVINEGQPDLKNEKASKNESSVCCFNLDEPDTDSPPKFCDFQCAIITFIVISMIVIISALIGTIVFSYTPSSTKDKIGD